jgi:AraC-like DNA-binding protein
MSQPRTRRGSPDVFEFEGVGDEALEWLDRAYGTTFRLTGRLGTVRHHRVAHGSVAFDHLKIDAKFAFDSDPLPGLVVVDLLGGTSEYTRDHHTDRIHDGETVLMSGWHMPFSGASNLLEVRGTNLSAELVTAAVEEASPDYPWEHISFTSYVPRSPAAGARWRATVDQLSAAFPDQDDLLAHAEASRLLGYTLLQTFPNNVVDGAERRELDRDSRDATPSTLRRAQRIIEARAGEDLTLAALAQECRVTPRALQYAFRRHLGCTPLAYLRQVRLDLVRQSLLDGSSPTVSDAASRFGFFNPGRFASAYRQVFDENPRDTLQRAN